MFPLKDDLCRIVFRPLLWLSKKQKHRVVIMESRKGYIAALIGLPIRINNQREMKHVSYTYKG